MVKAKKKSPKRIKRSENVQKPRRAAAPTKQGWFEMRANALEIENQRLREENANQARQIALLLGQLTTKKEEREKAGELQRCTQGAYTANAPQPEDC